MLQNWEQAQSRCYLVWSMAVNGQKPHTKQALHILSFEVRIWEQMAEQILNNILDFCFEKNLICVAGAGSVLYVTLTNTSS